MSKRTNGRLITDHEITAFINKAAKDNVQIICYDETDTPSFYKVEGLQNRTFLASLEPHGGANVIGDVTAVVFVNQSYFVTRTTAIEDSNHRLIPFDGDIRKFSQRNHFRLAIDLNDRSVEIEVAQPQHACWGRTYQILDISAGGAKILVPSYDQSQFELTSKILTCLRMHETSADVVCEVIHKMPLRGFQAGDMAVGLSFEYLSDRDKRKVSARIIEKAFLRLDETSV